MEASNHRPLFMIMTLGGSTAPLKKSLTFHKPVHVIFLASHDTVSLAGDIIKSLDYKPVVQYEITEDPNRMMECYKKARNCIDRVRRSGAARNDVMVDYTGGTKVMTAALILAAAGNAFRFHYVGGHDRTKNGVGVVIDGKETFFQEASPWDLFAEEERRQVVALFNRRNFAACNEIIRIACLKTLPPEIRSYFNFIMPLSKGFLNWDQFKHKDALRYLLEGGNRLTQRLADYPDAGLENFLKEIESCVTFLNRLMKATDEMKVSHRILIDDLLNNAQRRIEDGRYDDAAARIYRALELYGQIHFFEATGSPNNAVDPGIVPSDLGESFIKRHRDPNSGKLKLPLTATFEFLKAVGNPAGIAFFEKMAEMKKIQSSRNKSILAHGIEPVTEKGVRSIFATVSNFVGATDVIAFPTLPGISEALENPPADAC
ncbi:MAG: TIGR02710 family CRISPR-associated protein [Deltaproteobacteria bacterium]|nr:TIGR02710 family CRISPR-associated protein [Deltaproteobacteria bacterium]